MRLPRPTWLPLCVPVLLLAPRAAHAQDPSPFQPAPPPVSGTETDSERETDSENETEPDTEPAPGADPFLSPSPADASDPFVVPPPSGTPPPAPGGPFVPPPPPSTAPPPRYVAPPAPAFPRLRLLGAADLEPTAYAAARERSRQARGSFWPSGLALAAVTAVGIWATTTCDDEVDDEACTRESNVLLGSVFGARIPVLTSSALFLATCKRLEDAGLRVPSISRARWAVALASIPFPTFGLIAFWISVKQHRRVRRMLDGLERGERLPPRPGAPGPRAW